MSLSNLYNEHLDFTWTGIKHYEPRRHLGECKEETPSLGGSIPERSGHDKPGEHGLDLSRYPLGWCNLHGHLQKPWKEFLESFRKSKHGVVGEWWS